MSWETTAPGSGTPKRDNAREPKMQVRRASEMPAPIAPTWLARGYVPRCEITVLVGEEGIGKSLAWVVLVAHITTGTRFAPFNLPAREPQDVVIIITEDALGEVFARLQAAGADLSRVHVFSEDEDGSGSPTFPEHQGVLLSWVTRTGIQPALIVVDAWLDTVESGLQVRNTQHGRQALAPWKDIATRLQAAVILVTHTNRMDTANTRDLLGSTVALRQKARMILFAARHPDDGKDGEAQHVWIGPEKSNTTGRANAVRFTISIGQHRPQTDDDPGTVATLEHPEDAGDSIRQLIGEWRQEQQSADREPNKPEQAGGWLKSYMAGKGATAVGEVREAGKAAGFGERAIRVAMGNVGESKPAGPGQPWIYSIQSVQQSVQPVPITCNTAHTAHTAHTGDSDMLTDFPAPVTPLTRHVAHTADTGLVEIQSVQSTQSVQSAERYPEVAHTGSACTLCGNALLAPQSLALGVCGKTDLEHVTARAAA